MCVYIISVLCVCVIMFYRLWQPATTNNGNWLFFKCVCVRKRERGRGREGEKEKGERERCIDERE